MAAKCNKIVGAGRANDYENTKLHKRTNHGSAGITGTNTKDTGDTRD